MTRFLMFGLIFNITMDFHIVKMYKEGSQQKCQKYLLSMCDVKVFLTFTFVVNIHQVTRVVDGDGLR